MVVPVDGEVVDEQLDSIFLHVRLDDGDVHVLRDKHGIVVSGISHLCERNEIVHFLTEVDRSD